MATQRNLKKIFEFIDEQKKEASLPYDYRSLDVEEKKENTEEDVHTPEVLSPLTDKQKESLDERAIAIYDIAYQIQEKTISQEDLDKAAEEYFEITRESLAEAELTDEEYKEYIESLFTTSATDTSMTLQFKEMMDGQNEYKTSIAEYFFKQNEELFGYDKETNTFGTSRLSKALQDRYIESLKLTRLIDILKSPRFQSKLNRKITKLYDSYVKDADKVISAYLDPTKDHVSVDNIRKLMTEGDSSKIGERKAKTFVVALSTLATSEKLSREHSFMCYLIVMNYISMRSLVIYNGDPMLEGTKSIYCKAIEEAENIIDNMKLFNPKGLYIPKYSEMEFKYQDIAQ